MELGLGKNLTSGSVESLLGVSEYVELTRNTNMLPPTPLLLWRGSYRASLVPLQRPTVCAVEDMLLLRSS